jgi:hypothetical protein
MGKSSSAANVINLDAFRQRKLAGPLTGRSLGDSKERGTEMRGQSDAAMFVPVWFCWVPVWAPMVR